MPLFPTSSRRGSPWRTSESASIRLTRRRRRPAAPPPGCRVARRERPWRSPCRCPGTRTGRCRASRPGGCWTSTNLPRLRAKIAAVADDDRVVASRRAQLAVDAAGFDRRRVGGEQLGIGRTPRCSAARSSAIHPRGPDVRAVIGKGAQHRCDVARRGGHVDVRGALLDAVDDVRHRAAPNRPNPNRKSSGVPNTTTRSARCFSNPRVRKNASWWRAGSMPCRDRLKKHGRASARPRHATRPGTSQ